MTEKIKWKKLGAGSFRLCNGEVINSGQVFEASPDQIPENFRDIVVPVNAESLQELDKIEVVSPEYKAVLKTVGWYDVVDLQGKVLNEKSLRHPEALALIESLS